MKYFNSRRLMISGTLLLLVIILIVFVSMDIFTYSRYEKAVSSQNSLATALYLLDDEYQTINVTLPDVVPSNNQYTYTFSVSNYKDDLHCNTNLKYVIHIRTTTNLRIGYELYNTLTIQNATSDIASNTVTTDYYGTYFRNIYSSEKRMLYSEDKTDYYTLVFNFPSDYHDAIYSGIAELIEINVESSQILASDT